MKKPLRVLLVEDNPGDSDFIKEILEAAGGEVFELTDVARLDEAARAAKRETFDVVLLDLGLPDSAGLETLRGMRQQAPDVPIVVVTGNIEDQVGLAAIKEGAQDFVVKGQVTGAYLGKVLSFARERHDISRRLQESEDLLHQSQKMEALGQLAGGIAHDFNNLLTAILGYSDLLLKVQELSDPLARQGLAEIRHAAQRAASLTQQILSFSRRQTMRTQVVSLDEVLNGMEPLLRRTLGEDIDLVISHDSEEGAVDIDLHLFEQVLLNLAVNARDAMTSGGRLTIETGHVQLDDAYCCNHQEVAPGGYSLLAVSDTGCGMSDATIDRIFEPFFTTKPVGQGTGLGLATVYGVVRQSGGSISVYSEVGKGTCFKIYLPPACGAIESEVPAPEVPESPAGGGETILVVEDESALRDLVYKMLSDLGYRVLCAAGAEEALGLIDDSGPALDLLLTDLVLPGGIQGHDLAGRAAGRMPGLRVLYMSGYTRDGAVQGRRLGRDVSFLEKPFTLHSLAKAVRLALDQAPRVC
jgi:two-component system, cell cycle sensor histidine kinase and response regulator CckA